MQSLILVVAPFIVPIILLSAILWLIIKPSSAKPMHYRLLDPLLTVFLISSFCFLCDYFWLPKILVPSCPEVSGPIFLFMRSGALMTVAGLYILFHGLHWNKKEQSAKLNFILILFGTLIWGYGDLCILLLKGMIEHGNLP